MENLAHSLTGLAIAKGGLGERVPFGAVALVAAANAPDLDIVMTLEGTLHYLHYHRGITHSLVGTVVLGLILGLAIFGLRRFSRVPHARLSDCLWITQAAALTHPLLDLTNSYGLRPFLPLSDARYFGDLVFIVDPYLWLILGSATFLATRWRRWGRLLWGLGLAAVTTLSFLVVERVPAMKVYLVVLVVVVAATWAIRRRQGPLGTGSAWIGLALMVGYWLALGGFHSLAIDQASSALAAELKTEGPMDLSAIPRPADPLSWDVFFRDDQQIYSATAHSLRAGLLALQKHPTHLNLPEVGAALQSCPGRILAGFGRFVSYRVEKTEDGPDVVFQDLRFTRDGGSGFGTYRIPLWNDLSGLRHDDECPPPGSYLP